MHVKAASPIPPIHPWKHRPLCHCSGHDAGGNDTTPFLPHLQAKDSGTWSLSSCVRALPRGAALVSRLYEAVRLAEAHPPCELQGAGASLKDTVMRLLERASRPYLTLLARWVYQVRFPTDPQRITPDQGSAATARLSRDSCPSTLPTHHLTHHLSHRARSATQTTLSTSSPCAR
jgi:hypothetical protein